jgi:hypothetical protein
MEKHYKLPATLIAILVLISGCYSFKGGSVPPHLKTIAIPTFSDQSGSGEASLRETFTNKVIEKFIQDNSLELADQKVSDSILECTVTSLRDEPLSIVAGESVAKRKITISVQIVFKDMKFKKTIFDKQLSNWGEYNTSGGPDIRKAAIGDALDKLTEDILLETVSGW